MAEKPIKVMFPPINGQMVDAVVVPINESVERWTDLTLEDGSNVRLKVNALSAARIENNWDKDGNPIYMITSNQVMIVGSAPEKLRKPQPQGPVN
jgi:hypothetical protein